ncbi:MAG: hypothetical protein NC094_01545 [Bacteroidales bacterium]|nr:hypothetical protein [Lachnoclostridium sp.]MCM1384535.1 hypothetical protein [Lachnoclostridium sp.]MCM1464079.1 hypothetical protein [Bacteroidales bacterium]
MEYLVLILVLGVFVAVVFVKEAYSAKRRERQFVKELYENFGGIPDKEYALERYTHMGSYFHRHKQDGQIDDITWNDLNMDDIFKRMNYAFSASGEEYLYYTLRNTCASTEELEHLEEVAGYFLEHPNERVKIQYLMAKLGHTGKYSLYDYLENLDILGKRSNKKHIFLDILFLPFILLAPFKLSLALLGISVLICYNILTYFKEKGEIEPYIISFAYLVRLLNACDKMIKTEVPPCREEWKSMGESLDRLKNISRHSYFVFSKNRYSTSGNPLDILVDYLRMTFHLDLIQFNTMLERLQNNMDAADTLITLTGYVETAICIGAFRASLKHGYCIPEFLKENGAKGLCLKESYHPLLEEPVKNSIDTAQKGILLTGSNASGKSTFLKTVALNVILAQTIHTCTASFYRAPLYRVYSSMSLRDDIQGGESYYMVEIRAMKRILDGTKESAVPIICFVDEVLRGTNTIERIAASTQILRSLYDRGTLCFAATHDIELTELLKDVYENYHFEEEIRDGDVVFPYQLLHGKSTTRNAIRLLEIMGYEEDIIQQAFAMAEQLMGNWNFAPKTS